jgi:hypothetical protein
MVTSQGICENKMDNRESKSVVGSVPRIVKEQRADGNGQVRTLTCLRCALTSFERKPKINILSKEIYPKFYSIISINKSDRIDCLSPVNP